MEYNSNAKLLLSGEYLVLKGAKALALPLQLGQSLIVKSSLKENKQAELYWKSYEQDLLWFELRISLPDFSIIETSDRLIADRLIHVLQSAQSINNHFLEDDDYYVESKMSFLREWGLGSSSTLINNIAEWANIGPYNLLSQTFGGSGYDIACASARQPLIFSLLNKKPMVEPCDFNPGFKENLFFIYQGKKQNSSESVKEFNKIKDISDLSISEISEISLKLSKTSQLSEFKNLIKQHEEIIAKTLGLTAIKKTSFSDFNGEIKSLGAWGGDFLMAATDLSNEEVFNYFKNKGLDTIFKYTDLVIGY